MKKTWFALSLLCWRDSTGSVASSCEKTFHGLRTIAATCQPWYLAAPFYPAWDILMERHIMQHVVKWPFPTKVLWRSSSHTFVKMLQYPSESRILYLTIPRHTKAFTRDMGYNPLTNHLSNQSSTMEFYSERLFAHHTKNKQQTCWASQESSPPLKKIIIKQ